MPIGGRLAARDCAVLLEKVSEPSQTTHVDCVDSLVSLIADDISRQCDLSPHLPIATYDTADYMRSRQIGRLRLTVLDLRSLDMY
jgi:hypothetical protein